MALRKLLSKKKLDEQRKLLTGLETRATELAERTSAIEKREAEAAAAVEELTDEATDEERKVVEDEADEIEAEKSKIEEDKAALEKEKSELEAKIAELEAELAEEDLSVVPKEGKERQASPAQLEERNNMKNTTAQIRSGFFKGWVRSDAEAYVEREDIKSFLTEVRGLADRKQRAVAGVELTFPDTLIGTLRDNVHRYSKLIKHVWHRPLKGTGRINVTGEIPEGVWTEACASLNELDLNFFQYEVDGYKVGGFISICNATLEDSDLNLANEILDAIGQAIGIAVDKAILYGTGVKMPVGIVTRLAQSVQPAGYSAKAPAWVDLSTTNVKQVTGATAEELFANLILAAGEAKPNYGAGGKFWAMNEKTKLTLLAKLVTFNASGAIVANMENTLPIIGGQIEVLPFMADGDIVGGYGQQYLLVERAGMKFASSEHVRFIEDNTVFKGTARYDGTPLKGEGFVALNIAAAVPTKVITFAPDEANVEDPEP